MAIIIINGIKYEMKKSLEIIHGTYYVDGIKVGNDDIDNLTYKICVN